MHNTVYFSCKMFYLCTNPLLINILMNARSYDLYNIINSTRFCTNNTFPKQQVTHD